MQPLYLCKTCCGWHSVKAILILMLFSVNCCWTTIDLFTVKEHLTCSEILNFTIKNNRMKAFTQGNSPQGGLVFRLLNKIWQEYLFRNVCVLSRLRFGQDSEMCKFVGRVAMKCGTPLPLNEVFWLLLADLHSHFWGLSIFLANQMSQK